MSVRVGDRDRSPLRHPEQGKVVETGGVDDRLEVSQPGTERDIGWRAVGESAPSVVIADDGEVRAERGQPVAPHGARPVVLEVGQPSANPNKDGAGPVASPGYARAVGGGREGDPLSHPAIVRTMAPSVDMGAHDVTLRIRRARGPADTAEPIGSAARASLIADEAPGRGRSTIHLLDRCRSATRS
jgi:hypothetical protein